MEFNIELSKDGYKIVKVSLHGKTQYIGSKYNEENEINKFLHSYEPYGINDNYIVFGLCCGEHIKKLLEKIGPKSKVLIIEVNKNLIKYWEISQELKTIFIDPRIIIAKGKEDIYKFFNDYVTEININNIKVGFYSRYESIYKDELKEVYENIKNEVTRITSNRNIKLHYGDIWFDLLLKNLPYISKGIPVNDLKNQYKDVPAIIVSAGPSLNKNIHELQNVKSSLILSGGRTLKALMERNIKLDFICAVDPLEESYKLVQGYIDKVKCPLVFYEGTNDKIVRDHKKEKIFSTNSQFINKLYKKHIQSLSSGGSVAHSMTFLAAYMGCNPIIFVGQDLAYTGEQGHAKCAEDSFRKVTFEDYKKTDDIYVKDINGNEVRTSITLNSFKIALENIISLFPNIKFINSTEGGVNIKGAENKNLKEVVEEIEGNERTPVKLLPKKEEDKTKELLLQLRKVIKDLEEYKEVYSEREIAMLRFKDQLAKIPIELTSEEIDQIKKMDYKLEKIINSLGIIKDRIFKVYYKYETLEEFNILSSDDFKEATRKSFMKNSRIFYEVKKLAQDAIDKINVAIDNIK